MPVLHTDMSETDMDRLPRMKDYLRAEDLNTDAAVTLATEVLREAANEYIHVVRRVREDPGNQYAADHLRTLQAFYRSDWFRALSMGTVDGEIVMKELSRMAGRTRA